MKLIIILSLILYFSSPISSQEGIEKELLQAELNKSYELLSSHEDIEKELLQVELNKSYELHFSGNLQSIEFKSNIPRIVQLTINFDDANPILEEIYIDITNYFSEEGLHVNYIKEEGEDYCVSFYAFGTVNIQISMEFKPNSNRCASILLNEFKEINFAKETLVSGAKIDLNLDSQSQAYHLSFPVKNKSFIDFTLTSLLTVGTDRYKLMKISNLEIRSITNQYSDIIAPINYIKFKDSIRFSFLLDTGIYIINLIFQQDYYEKLNKSNSKNRKEKLVLNITSIKDYKAPEAINTFLDWYISCGFNGIMDFNFYSPISDIGSLISNNFSNKIISAQKYVGVMRNKINANDSLLYYRILDSLQYNLDVDLSNYKWLDKTKFPKHFICFSPKSALNDIADFEKSFFQLNKITIWGKIFQKLRLTNQFIPPDILIYIKTQDEYKWVFSNVDTKEDSLERNSIGHIAVLCSSIHSIQLPAFSKSIQGDYNSSLTERFEFKIDRISHLLTNNILKLPDETYSLSFYEINTSYFELTISDIKNVILKGADYWEKITIRGFIRENLNQYYLDVLVDGLYTSGAGPAPSKSSQYDKNFEPKYTQNLTEFAKICTFALKDNLN